MLLIEEQRHICATRVFSNQLAGCQNLHGTGDTAHLDGLADQTEWHAVSTAYKGDEAVDTDFPPAKRRWFCAHRNI